MNDYTDSHEFCDGPWELQLGNASEDANLTGTCAACQPLDGLACWRLAEVPMGEESEGAIRHG